MTGSVEAAAGGLERRAHRLLAEAAAVFRDHGPAGTWLHHHLERLGEPLRLALAGPRRAGKSTLVNALIGEELAPVPVAGGTRVPVWFEDGPQPRARLFPGWGPPCDVPVERTAAGIHLAAGDADVQRAVVEWPSRALRRTRLLDAPEPAVDVDADAVLYLTPHLGDDDVERLRAGRGERGAAAYPVHLMVVLSRADEVAGGRADAVLTAKQIARRRRREPRVATLCQDVLAVSPLLALAARTLREDEYATIAALAALTRAETEPHLLSTDRFTAADFPMPLPADRRAALLDRLGLAGVRLAVTLVRTSGRGRNALGEQLLRHSGMAELQASMADLFTDRRGVLKARTALIALDQVLRSEPRPQAGHLAAELERLVAGAHEFRELRLLAALRTGRVTLPGELAVEARRLAGGDGTAPAERLGAPAGMPAAELWSLAQAATVRWRQETSSAPTAGERRAAGVVLRSCAGILAALA